ncbi:MAG: TonB-dependent receptor [Betaproteobacteria bacterium]
MDLLVLCFQGGGRTLQFARYIAGLAIVAVGAVTGAPAQELPTPKPVSVAEPETLPMPAPAAKIDAPAIPEEAVRSGKTSPLSSSPPRAAEKKQEVKAIEVNAQRLTTTDERRESAAGKIIVGRDEIEKYGSSELVDVLRRLPGVTVLNGAVSMRGMGAGFTQILIDGERVAPGFSIEQLSPEQVERIEILRAPTAETGARAIAGTINIILRKPRRNKQDDFKAGLRVEESRFGGDISLSRNDALTETGTYNLTLTGRNNRTISQEQSRVVNSDIQSGAISLDRNIPSTSINDNWYTTLSSQVQWKWRDDEQLVIQPFFSRGHYESNSEDELIQAIGANPPYATSRGRFNSHFSTARFAATLSKKLTDKTKYELRTGVGRVQRRRASGDYQSDIFGMNSLVQTTDSESQDISWNASAKVVHQFSDTHKFTAGLEIEAVKRADQTLALLNGVKQLAEFGSALDVSTRRRALFGQEEWDPAPDWSANVGVRWEGFETRSNADSSGDGGVVRNSSSIVTPLAHLVWRFNAPKRNQFRLSLTQSYQTPGLFNLVPRPRLDSTYPVPGPNIAANPDYAGNPFLKPERANGIDFSYEHYSEGGGVVAINLYSRRINDLVRGVILLENVSWAASPRYVQRSRNIGRATSNGIEFDAKLQLSEMIAGGPPVDMHANVSVFDSKVDSVPGPNNRLNGQPRAKGNFGADYRPKGSAFAVGATVSYTPSYTIQDTAAQQSSSSASRTIDAYVLWTITPTTKLRLTVSNLAPRNYAGSLAVVTELQRQATYVTSVGYTVAALRLEMRL